MNRKIVATTVLSAALVIGLGACKQETATPGASAAPAPVAAAPAEPATPAINIATGTYKMDPAHTMVLAQWNHMGFSNPTANFEGVTGTIHWNAADPTASSVEVEIPMSGLRAFSADFNKHLSSADFFDVAKFPDASFKSTSVTAAGANQYTVVGDLTLKGITKPVTLKITSFKCMPNPIMQKDACGVDATTMIKRSDFNMGKYAPNVGDEVTLSIAVEALKS